MLQELFEFMSARHLLASEQLPISGRDEGRFSPVRVASRLDHFQRSPSVMVVEDRIGPDAPAPLRRTRRMLSDVWRRATLGRRLWFGGSSERSCGLSVRMDYSPAA